MDISLNKIKDLPIIYTGSAIKIYIQNESEYRVPVLIKVPNQEAVTPQQAMRFANEYEITRNLELPGVQRALDHKLMDYGPVLILEYFQGETLEEQINRREYSTEKLLRVAISIVQILRGLHERRIVHKNINSRNILLDEKGHATIIDFGIAEFVDPKAKHLGIPTKLEGTMTHIAPEQTGKVDQVVDHRADLYSFGVILYEMFSGELPFQSSDSLELVHCHVAMNPDPIKSVPAIISELILKLMSKNPEERYQSARGVLKDLQRCLSQQQTTGTITPFPLGQDDFSESSPLILDLQAFTQCGGNTMDQELLKYFLTENREEYRKEWRELPEPIRYFHHLTITFYTGMSLKSIKTLYSQYMAIAHKLNQPLVETCYRMFTQAVLNLTGESGETIKIKGELFDEQKKLPEFLERKDKLLLSHYYMLKVFLCNLFESYEEGIKLAEEGEQYIAGLPEQPVVYLFYFHYALLLPKVYKSMSNSTSSEYFDKLLFIQDRINTWESHDEQSQLHKFALVSAELAKISGNDDDALFFFDQALDEAIEHEYIQDSAIIQERMAEFYLARGQNELAASAIIKAQFSYKLWEGVAKVDDIEQKYAAFLPKLGTTIL